MCLTVIILTYNEALHIERCIKSLLPITSNIYVVDSYSNDKTKEIAESLEVKVYQNPFINQAVQFNWGIKNCPISTPWIMRLDADEYLTPELRKELEERLPILPLDITGIVLKYKHYFMDRWIRFGTRYPLPLLRIWRTGKGIIENKWMDERVVLSEGRTITFKEDFIHDDLNDIHYLIDKHNGYATREAIDFFIKKYKITNSEPEDETIKKQHFELYAKNNFYNRSPLFLRSLVYFFYRYFIRLGFLDGTEGLVYHFLQGFWYRMLVDAKIWEFKRKFYDDKEKIMQFIQEKYNI